MRYSIRVAALLLTAASLSAPAGAQVPTTSTGDVKVDRINVDQLRSQMRKLWVGNAIWMREYIVNTIEADPSLDAATTRLAKSQQEIGRALVPYYGNDVAAKVTTLLNQHTTIVSEMIAAARAKNTANLKVAEQRWTANANELATVLSTANPNWAMTTVQPMIGDALSLTALETKARLDRNYQLDVETFDRILEKSLAVADTFSEGIIKQFPNK